MSQTKTKRKVFKERVQVSRREGETDWVLGFKFVSERDEGMYECQVNTNVIKKCIFKNVFQGIVEIFLSSVLMINTAGDLGQWKSEVSECSP